MIHLLRQPATAQQVQEMLEAHETYIKVAVDVRGKRGRKAGTATDYRNQYLSLNSVPPFASEAISDESS